MTASIERLAAEGSEIDKAIQETRTQAQATVVRVQDMLRGLAQRLEKDDLAAGELAEALGALESELAAMLKVLRKRLLRKEGLQAEREKLQGEITSAVHQVWEQSRS